MKRPRLVVGVDFGAPRRAADQRRKILAVSAISVRPAHYRIEKTALNARLFANDPPGWTAEELTDALLEHPARVVGFDFPFCVPHKLLEAPDFASDVGYPHGAFRSWRPFNAWIAERLPFRDPIDYAPFAAWRNPDARARLWTKRATDLATGAQPPLKDLVQATFQMTLLGNALLAKLAASKRYRVLPFDEESGGAGELIEVYPRATLRAMGLSAYKAAPTQAMQLAHHACASAGIALEVDPEFLALGRRYNSGTMKAPDHDVADAWVALCTAILHAEGAAHPSVGADPREGAIWVPSLDGRVARNLRL